MRKQKQIWRKKPSLIQSLQSTRETLLSTPIIFYDSKYVTLLTSLKIASFSFRFLLPNLPVPGRWIGALDSPPPNAVLVCIKEVIPVLVYVSAVDGRLVCKRGKFSLRSLSCLKTNVW